MKLIPKSIVNFEIIIATTLLSISKSFAIRFKVLFLYSYLMCLFDCLHNILKFKAAKADGLK